MSMWRLTNEFGEKLRYCGGNVTEGDDSQFISLSPKLFDLVRRELGWTKPVMRVDDMTTLELDVFVDMVNTLASQ